MEGPLVWSRLSSPFTYDTGGIKADGYQLVTILTYHDIKAPSRSQMQVTPKEFEEQMSYLNANGYRVISLDDFFDFINLRQGVPDNSVVITFDDGWRSVYTTAYPILKKYGFPATIFIYTDFISPGNRTALTWDMMKELSAGGIDIQVHSRTHEQDMPRKREAETEQGYRKRLDNELLVPKNLAEQQVGKRIKYIAYPYGQFNDDFIQLARNAGYEGGLTVFGATVKDGEVVRKRDNPVFVKPFEVSRVQVLAGTSLRKFISKLKSFHPEPVYDGRYDDLLDLKGLQSPGPNNSDRRSRIKKLETSLNDAVQKHLTAGKAYYRSGDTDASRKEFLMALFLDPGNQEALGFMRELPDASVSKVPVLKKMAPLSQAVKVTAEEGR